VASRADRARRTFLVCGGCRRGEPVGARGRVSVCARVCVRVHVRRGPPARHHLVLSHSISAVSSAILIDCVRPARLVQQQSARSARAFGPAPPAPPKSTHAHTDTRWRPPKVSRLAQSIRRRRQRSRPARPEYNQRARAAAASEIDCRCSMSASIPRLPAGRLEWAAGRPAIIDVARDLLGRARRAPLKPDRRRRAPRGASREASGAYSSSLG
jgi:hypothetical protein